MNFARALFFLLTLLFMAAYLISVETHFYAAAIISLMVATTVTCTDLIFKRFALKSFTLSLLGMFFGYLMGLALSAIFTRMVAIAQLELAAALVGGVQLSLFLLGLYVGTVMTMRASEEFAISLPFIRLSQKREQTTPLLVDESALRDPRLIDLLNTGLFDHRLIVPRALLRQLESDGKPVTDLLRRLDEHGVRFYEGEVDRTKHLAKLLNTDLLISMPGVHAQEPETNTVNLHAIALALKPLTPKGEVLKIKVQRIGKEEDQGVGYLDDGTMVVINGGALYLGETIDSRVLSVKHTSSGRMIFCNVLEMEVSYS